jgi:hypothetical protein
MTRVFDDSQGRALGSPAPGGIFTRSARRDLADLNRQYLELGLRADASSDPLFCWTVEVRQEIERAEPDVRERMAACPFALLDLRLPSGQSVPDSAPGTELLSELDRVEDRLPGRNGGATRPAGCVAFTQGALFTAWRLAESAPLVARIAFGLSPAAELELNETCPTRIAMLAMRPGVVGARWPRHSQFWAMLRGAALVGSGSALQWAHCAGICLMEG